ncbi:MAG TPA: DUF4097 family beta strand repeat-containing protein, partial [Vicinamibacterales bacterium]|nr:DUF4097 family beta strand repeat-containing protein [Vicinamibacterales bacterium]
MKLSTPAGAVVLAGLLTTGCVVSVDSQAQILREEKRFSVNGTPDVTLTTFDGPIEINAWDRREVVVDVEKRGATRQAVESIDVKTSQKGNRIEVEARRPRDESFTGIGLQRSAHAKLIVSVPRDANLNARTGDGSIRVDGVKGRLQLKTGDGSIRAAEVSGEVSLSTGDGSITVDRAEGRLDVDTGDGGVDVTGRFAAVKLHTGDGSIVYRAENGSVMTDDWEISTGDGSVALYLPSGFDADLDAHTGDGSIRNDLAVETADGGKIDRRTIRARLGAGGRLLR